MKKSEISVGGLYEARVSGRYTTVRVDAINDSTSGTAYDVTNLATGRTTTFRSAAKFRTEMRSKPCPQCKKHVPLAESYTFGMHATCYGKSRAAKMDTEAARRAKDEQRADPVPVVVLAATDTITAQTSAAQTAEGEQCSDPQNAPSAASELPQAIGTGASCANGASVSDATTTVTATECSEADSEMPAPDLDEYEPARSSAAIGPARSPSYALPPVLSVGQHTAAEWLAQGRAESAALPKEVRDAVVNTCLARRIADAQKHLAQVTDGVSLTEEQAEILATARQIEDAKGNGQRVLVIGAGAGTGKTFTLKQLERALKGRGQYTAFNKSLVTESKAKFKSASCDTTHALAFRAVGCRYKHRLNGARQRSYEIARRLGIEDYYVELPEAVAPSEDGKPQMRRLKSDFLAGQVIAAIRRFCQSAEREIGAEHFRTFAGLDATVADNQQDHTNSNKVRDYLLPFARKAWADLSSESGTLPFSHDYYVKIWQLGDGPDRPVINADYILLDEAQDTAPVMLDVLRRQEHSLLILVGDDNQQIYEWRGAVNALASFKGAPRRLLSQSFRFGQAIADVANTILATLEQPTDLVMKGLASIPSRVCTVSEPRCYLYRTNAGAVARLMRAREEGKRGHLIGGSEEVVKFCDAAIDLQEGNSTSHPELGCFATWAEVIEYSKTDEGADLRLMVKLINEFGADNIRDALKGMPDEKDADLILSTAHRSKGREWKSVKLGPDFPLSNKMTDADRRLLYVACTRAQEELDISECPTFCGGKDRAWSEAGSETRFVPGLEVRYTVDMPSEKSLADYRAGAMAPSGNGQVTPSAPATVAATTTKTDDFPFTWANLNGTWTIRGPANRTGERVTVTRKNGTTSKETLRSVVKKQDGKVWFYGLK